jgi:predicted Zn-dependent protease
VVADPGILAAIRQAAPAYRSRFTSPPLRPRRTRFALAGGALALAVGAAMYFWGIPWLAARAAVRVPLQWEERLGRSLVEQLVPDQLVCHDPERQAAVERIVERLIAATPAARYRFRVTLVDDSMVNAFAAPGGYIVVHRGLLEHTRTPEELAGVLAHELQHVLQRHGTGAVFREIPLRLVVAAATGDAGVTGHLLGAAATLGTLRYRRRDEAAADRAGMDMLRAARIAPDGMIRFFAELEREGKDLPAVVAYLSTHPRNAARLEALERQAAEPGAEPVVPLDRAGWPPTSGCRP